MTPALPAAAAGPARPRPATAALLSDTAFDELAAAIAGGAVVAGLGESTRFAHETFTVRDQAFPPARPSSSTGFRALVLQDHRRRGRDA